VDGGKGVGGVDGRWRWLALKSLRALLPAAGTDPRALVTGSLGAAAFLVPVLGLGASPPVHPWRVIRCRRGPNTLLKLTLRAESRITTCDRNNFKH
jgi:hypothetical protein